jgi:fructuronate reductase
MDGSVKLPVRMLGTVRDRLAAGAEPRTISLAVAAWMVYVLRTPDLDDPQSDKLKAAVAGISEPAKLVDALLAMDSIFTPDLRDSAVFRDLLIEHVGALTI